MGKEQEGARELTTKEPIVYRVTDDNYILFKESPRAVLVVSTSWCPSCAEYKPTVELLAQEIPGILFGNAILDMGYLGKLKRDYDMTEWSVPTTILIRDGQPIGKFEGAYPYGTAFEIVKKNLIGDVERIQPETGYENRRDIRSLITLVRRWISSSSQ